MAISGSGTLTTGSFQLVVAYNEYYKVLAGLASNYDSYIHLSSRFTSNSNISISFKTSHIGTHYISYISVGS